MPRFPEIGEVLAGKFRLVGKIGEGAMGVVFEAEQIRLKRRVAIKMLRPTALEEPTAIERFQREARAAALLENRHIARILDVDEADGLPFMVLELLDGNDLEHELTSRGRLPVDEAVAYVLEACIAMREAHARGIVHRDLKPSNLFLAREEGARVVKVLDFGISKVQEEGNMRLTAVDSAMGTPLYMSPEQVRSARHADARSDIWALGVILYELLAGVAPFDGSTVTALAAAIVTDDPVPLDQRRSDVPTTLGNAVTRALAKKPGDRFQDVASFAAALAPFSPHVRMSATSLGPMLAATAPTSAGGRHRDARAARSSATLPGGAATTAFRSGLRVPRATRIVVPAAAFVVTVGVGFAWLATKRRDAASAAGSAAPPSVATMMAVASQAAPPPASWRAPGVASAAETPAPGAPDAGIAALAPLPRGAKPPVVAADKRPAASPAKPRGGAPPAAPAAKTPPPPDNPDRL